MKSGWTGTAGIPRTEDLSCFSGESAQKRRVECLQHLRQFFLKLVCSASFSRYKEVKRKLGQTGLTQSIVRMNVGEIWEAFLSDPVQKAMRKPTTCRNYLVGKDRFFDFFKPEVYPDEITSGDAIAWKRYLTSKFTEASAAGYIQRTLCDSTSRYSRWSPRRKKLSCRVSRKELPFRRCRFQYRPDAPRQKARSSCVPSLIIFMKMNNSPK